MNKLRALGLICGLAIGWLSACAPPIPSPGHIPLGFSPIKNPEICRQLEASIALMDPEGWRVIQAATSHTWQEALLPNELTPGFTPRLLVVHLEGNPKSRPKLYYLARMRGPAREPLLRLLALEESDVAIIRYLMILPGRAALGLLVEKRLLDKPGWVSRRVLRWQGAAMVEFQGLTLPPVLSRPEAPSF
jgi:hypothetical protein